MATDAMVGGIVGQLSAVGPINAVRLCRSACAFYRMKEKADQALGKGLLEKERECRLKGEAAFADMRLSVEKICERMAAELRKEGKEREEKAAQRVLCSRGEMTCKLAGLASGPGFGIGKLAAGISVAAAGLGIGLGERDVLKVAAVGAVLALMMCFREFAQFVGQVAWLLERKLRDERS